MGTTSKQRRQRLKVSQRQHLLSRIIKQITASTKHHLHHENLIDNHTLLRCSSSDATSTFSVGGQFKQNGELNA